MTTIEHNKNKIILGKCLLSDMKEISMVTYDLSIKYFIDLKLNIMNSKGKETFISLTEEDKLLKAIKGLIGVHIERLFSRIGNRGEDIIHFEEYINVPIIDIIYEIIEDKIKEYIKNIKIN